MWQRQWRQRNADSSEWRSIMPLGQFVSRMAPSLLLYRRWQARFQGTSAKVRHISFSKRRSGNSKTQEDPVVEGAHTPRCTLGTRGKLCKKDLASGNSRNGRFWCRLASMSHSSHRPPHFSPAHQKISLRYVEVPE